LTPRRPRRAQEGPQEPEDRQDHRSPCERTRDALEAAGLPEGVDYEALILAEDEEAEGGW